MQFGVSKFVDMVKIDLRTDLKPFYTAAADRIEIIDIPPLPFLMAEGRGEPRTSPAFRQAATSLFRVAHALKFMLKKEQGLDWTIMPLEALWDTIDPAANPKNSCREEWQWTLMILQPDFVTQEKVARAKELAGNTKNAPPLYDMALRRHTDGQSAQVLHVGPYAEAAATIARLHRFIRERGFHFGGRHHEIYLNDPRRTAPGKLKTIVRQPVSLEVQR